MKLLFPSVFIKFYWKRVDIVSTCSIKLIKFYLKMETKQTTIVNIYWKFILQTVLCNTLCIVERCRTIRVQVHYEQFTKACFIADISYYDISIEFLLSWELRIVGIYWILIWDCLELFEIRWIFMAERFLLIFYWDFIGVIEFIEWKTLKRTIWVDCIVIWLNIVRILSNTMIINLSACVGRKCC